MAVSIPPPVPAGPASAAGPAGPTRSPGTGRAAPDAAGGALGDAAERPETLVREYRNGRDYAADLARLQRTGWEVVSVLDRPAAPGWLHRATRRRAPVAGSAHSERLVTYIWRGRTGANAVALHPVRATRRQQRIWWLVLVLVLLALLALGLVSFFGDTLLPGLLLPLL